MFKIDWKKHFLRNSWLRSSFKFSDPKPGNFPPEIYPQHYWRPSAFVPSELPPEPHYIDQLAQAELDYENWQLQNGREIAERGVGPQDASEFQNLMALQENQGMQETADPLDSCIPEPFGAQGQFDPYENPAETMDEMQEHVAPEPEEYADMNNPQIDSAHDDSIAQGTEPAENMEPVPQQQAQEPMPEPMEEPMQNPYDPMDPMNPMGMDPFDPMNPMGMSGLLGP